MSKFEERGKTNFPKTQSQTRKISMAKRKMWKIYQKQAKQQQQQQKYK